MKYLFLSLALGSLMIPLACNYQTPNNYNTRGTSPRSNATLQPTPAFIATVSTGIAAPNGIAYASPYIYVAEGGNGASVSQVQVLNASNNTVNWTWTGAGSTLFQAPNGVAVNSAGTTVYVLDVNNSSGNGTVYALGPASTPVSITSWTSYNGTTLSYPGGIAVDSLGNVYVADSNNGLLEEFSPSGAAIASWNGNGGVAPVAVAVDSSNNVYVADGYNEELWVVKVSGSTFTVSNNWYLPYNNTSYVDYYGLALDAVPNVYLADYYNSNVDVYTNAGSQIGQFNGNQTGATTLGGPDALLLYNSDIYVGDYDSNNGSSTGIIEYLRA